MLVARTYPVLGIPRPPNQPRLSLREPFRLQKGLLWGLRLWTGTFMTTPALKPNQGALAKLLVTLPGFKPPPGPPQAGKCTQG